MLIADCSGFAWTPRSLDDACFTVLFGPMNMHKQTVEAAKAILRNIELNNHEFVLDYETDSKAALYQELFCEFLDLVVKAEEEFLLDCDERHDALVLILEAMGDVARDCRAVDLDAKIAQEVMNLAPRGAELNTMKEVIRCNIRPIAEKYGRNGMVAVARIRRKMGRESWPFRDYMKFIDDLRGEHERKAEDSASVDDGMKH